MEASGTSGTGSKGRAERVCVRECIPTPYGLLPVHGKGSHGIREGCGMANIDVLALYERSKRTEQWQSFHPLQMAWGMSRSTVAPPRQNQRFL